MSKKYEIAAASEAIYEILLPTGKASGLDHIWPDLIDYQKQLLSPSFFVKHDKCNLTDQIWSTCPAFIQD